MTISCRSYAKINLTLNVLGRRDDGFHEVRTVLQTIALHDSLIVEKTDGPIEVICDDPNVPTNEQNLVYGAAAACRRITGVKEGARVSIVKRIPVAAGLGGGSSNAAVALLALQRLWHIRLSAKLIMKLATELGSDVPFFFYGGTAVGLGRGSEVYPLPSVRLSHVLLVRPLFQVSTEDAYGLLSQGQQLTKEKLSSIITDSCEAVFEAWGVSGRTSSTSTWFETGSNDFEPGAVARHREIGQIMGRLGQLGARVIRLSGSGPTVFALFENGQQLEKAGTELASKRWQVIPTRTVDRDEYWQTLIRRE